MIRLNSVELNPDLLLEGVNQAILKQSITYCFGKPVVQYINYPKGRRLELISTNSGNEISGYFSVDDKSNFIDIMNNVQTVLLEHPLLTTNVLIVAGGVNLEIMQETNEECSDTIYTGTINLITV